jgi:hypothetical protein
MLAEPDQIIQLISSFLALILFVISLLAYFREHSKKLLLLSIAFFFYSAIKFINAASIFFPLTDEYLEFWGSLLDFFVLALLFLSMIARE